MAFNIIYQFTGTLYNKTFTVDILKDTAGTPTADNIDMIDVKYRIGSEQTEIDYPIIPNIWNFTLQDDNYSNNGYVFDQINTNDLTDFRIDVKEGSTLVFRGTPSEFGQVRKYDPKFNTFTFQFKATDGFGYLKGQRTETPTGLDDRGIQAILDTLNYGFNSRYFIDIDNQDLANSFLPDQFELNGIDTDLVDLNDYDSLVSYLNFYGLRIYQTEGRWHIIQENYVGQFTAFGDRTYDFYQVETSTYTTSTGSIVYDNSAGNRRYKEYGDDEFQNEPKVSVFKTLGVGEIKYKASNKLGIDRIDDLDVVTLNPFETQTASWRGVMDVKNVKLVTPVTGNTFDFALDITVTYPADPVTNIEGACTFNIDLVEFKWISLDGTNYWLNESKNWVTSQIFWSVTLETDSSGNKITPLDDTISELQDVDLPPDAGATGYMEVTIMCDITQTSGINFSPLSDAVDSVLFQDIDANYTPPDYYMVRATNEGLGGAFRYDYTDVMHDDRNEANPDFNWRSDKSRFKIADTIILARLARQFRKMTTFEGTLNEFIIPKFEAIYGLSGFDNSKDFKINHLSGNLFEEVTDVKFVEYDYDETDIVLKRGIYS